MHRSGAILRWDRRDNGAETLGRRESVGTVTSSAKGKKSALFWQIDTKVVLVAP